MNKKDTSNYGETIRDKLTLSPIQKYIKYDRYPYKLVFSLILVLLTTLATFNLLNIYSISGQSQLKVWKNVLCLAETPDGQNHILNIQDFQIHLFGMLNNFQNLQEILFQKIDSSETNYTIEVVPLFPVADLMRSNKTHKNDTILNLFYSTEQINENDDHMQIKTYIQRNNTNNTSFFSNNYTYPINLTEGILKPFDMNSPHDIKNFLQRVHQFSFNVKNLKLYLNTPLGTVDYHTCWDIKVNYQFYMTSYILAEASSSFFPCENVNETINQDNDDQEINLINRLKGAINFNQMEYSGKFMGDSIYTLHLAILFFASASLILNLKYIYEMIQVYLQTLIKSKRKRMMTESIIPTEYTNENEMQYYKKRTSQKVFKTLEKLLETDKPWHLLSFREKMLFFDFWFVLGIAANLVQMWASILVLFQEISTKEYHGTYVIEILIGFSCFLAWLNLIRYLEYNKSIFTISNIMKRSLPQMLQFSLGFIPIYMAYVFLGVSLFWRYERFKDPNEATMTLFSLIMGDNIYNFITTFKQYGLLSLVYFFSFLIIFFMAIQNIFVSIICSKAREKEPTSTKEKPDTKDATNLQTEGSKTDFNDLLKTNTKPIFKKVGSLENFTTQDEPSDWKKKTIQRMQSLTPKQFKNAQIETDPLLISTAYKKTLQRRATQNINALPGLDEEGAFSKVLKSIPIKKYKSIKQDLKDIEMTQFEKDRILDELKYLTETVLVWLDDMYRDNVADLEFYKLGFKDRIEITNEYLDQLKGLSLKIKDMAKFGFDI